MLFTQWLLLNIPSWILCALMIFASTVLSVSGLLLVRRYTSHKKLKTHNDIAGAIFGTIGMAYTVLLAFVVVVAWQSFDRSNLNVEKEANCLVDIIRDSECFPDSFKLEVNRLVSDYARSVIDDEWKSLARGEGSPKAQEIVKKIGILYAGYNPRTANERVFFEESVSKLNELYELRSFRLMDSRTGIHPVLWLVLVLGAVTTIVFTFFFGSENLTAQIMMTVLLSILITIILFTILALDFPFTGDVTISSDAFKQVFKY